MSEFGKNLQLAAGITAALASLTLLSGCLAAGDAADADPRHGTSEPPGVRSLSVAAADVVNRTFSDATGRIQIRVKACDPTPSATNNCAYCTVDDGWARIGGGAEILGEAAGGAMLQASYPDPNYFRTANSNGCTGPADSRPSPDFMGTWVARASGASHQLQAYVVGIRMLGSNGTWFKPNVSGGRDFGTTIANSPGITTVDSPPDQDNQFSYVIGGGAYIYKGDGNLNQATPTHAYLVGSYPVDVPGGRSWRAVARSRVNPAPAENMKAFSISILACQPEASRCLSYPEIRSVASAAVSGYGTAGATHPEFRIIGSVGGYAPTSSGGVRYLADLIPLSGTGQGFTARSKAFGTGTGPTTAYTLSFGFPFDIYTVFYLHSNKCLGVLGARTDPTAPVAQQTCTFGNEPSHLRFAMVPQSGGYRALKFEHSGLCVDINGASLQNSAAAIQYPCSYADNQLVQLIRNANGSQSFKFKHSGKCLDVEGASSIDGARFIQYTCNGQANQSFYWDD